MATTVLYNPRLPRIQQHTYGILPFWLVGLAAWFKVVGLAGWPTGSWYAITQRLTRDPLTIWHKGRFLRVGALEDRCSWRKRIDAIEKLWPTSGWPLSDRNSEPAPEHR